MRVEIVSYAAGNCHKYAADIAKRAVNFSVNNHLDSDPEILYHVIQNGIVSQNSDMLVLAAIEDDKVVGHLITRIVQVDGTLFALITQLEIDKEYRDGRIETISNGLDIIKQFAASRGAKAVRCWAMNQKLAILFGRLGFVTKPYVMMDLNLEE